MTTHAQYYLCCTKCDKQFVDSDGEYVGETAECIKDLATDNGWECDVEVPDGSDWDFCTKCKKN